MYLLTPIFGMVVFIEEDTQVISRDQDITQIYRWVVSTKQTPYNNAPKPTHSTL